MMGSVLEAAIFCPLLHKADGHVSQYLEVHEGASPPPPPPPHELFYCFNFYLNHKNKKGSLPAH